MLNRQNARDKWLEDLFGSQSFSLKPLAGDASFRHYYRLSFEDKSRILMDAPPEKEALGPFLAIAGLLKKAGLHAPEIFAKDESLGFVLLEDFGDCLLLGALNSSSADPLYHAAIQTLIQLQACPNQGLLAFDQNFMLQELNIFQEWFLRAYLKIDLDQSEQAIINTTFLALSQEIAQSPQVFIHRDYHSRNIMLLKDTPEIALGLIDFQDAMQGPLCYDLVSLLKDCYIQWPRERILSWLQYFHQASMLAQQYSKAAFVRAFDLAGLQRHLKVLGVFARLYLRDNKDGYLKDLPLTLHYVLSCLETYEEFSPFYQFMQTRIHLP